MARTTKELVEKIIELDATVNGGDISAFIETASALVDELCQPQGYSETRLELIERWLAAHFYAIRDPRLTSEQAGSVQASYESKVDLGLQLTRYGQQALMLDTKGGLAALNNQPKTATGQKPGIVYLGTNT